MRLSGRKACGLAAMKASMGHFGTGRPGWLGWVEALAAFRRPAPSQLACRFVLLACFVLYGVHSLGGDNGSAVHRAAAAGDGEALARLIADGANVNSENPSGRTALHLGALGGHDSLLPMLIDAGGGLDARDNGDNTALLLAISEARVASANLLIRMGADIDLRNEWGQTPLHWAMYKLPTVIQALLDAGAYVDPSTGWDADTRNWGTPLNMAATTDDLATVRLLIESGASPNPLGDRDRSSLHAAVRRGHDKVAAYLIDQGALVENTAGFSLLEPAQEHGLGAVLHRLLGPDAVTENASGEQLARWLLFAVHSDQVDRVAMLLDRRADINRRYIAGWTPLHYALLRARDHKRPVDVAMKLIERGADVTAATAGIGWTPLHLAVTLNDPLVAQALLNAGADVNATTSMGGWTPLQVAQWELTSRLQRSGDAKLEVLSVLTASGGTVTTTFTAINAHFGIYMEGGIQNYMRYNMRPTEYADFLYSAPSQGHAGGSRVVQGAFSERNAKERLVLEDIGTTYGGNDVVLVSLVDASGASRPVMATDGYMEFRRSCVDPATTTHVAVFLRGYGGNWRRSGDMAYMSYDTANSTLIDHYVDDTEEAQFAFNRYGIDRTCPVLDRAYERQ